MPFTSKCSARRRPSTGSGRSRRPSGGLEEHHEDSLGGTLGIGAPPPPRVEQYLFTLAGDYSGLVGVHAEPHVDTIYRLYRITACVTLHVLFAEVSVMIHG